MTTILVVVDLFTKMAHFLPCAGLPSAPETAQLLLTQVFRLHGLPDHLISDRGAQFTARFWQALFRALNVQIHLSSSHHPQSDGQTEHTNATVEQYLRCYTCFQQDNWVDLLPLAEFAYNNSVHASTCQIPFFASYGYHPRFFPSVQPPLLVPAADVMLQELQALQAVLKEQLEQAKGSYKRFADRHCQPGPPLKVGDQVWLSTKFLRSQRPSQKLEARNIGPFRITQQINPVAFRLQLPASFRIHPVFHRSLLTPTLPPHPLSSKLLPPPPIQVNGEEEFEVAQILDSRRHRGRLQYLIDWQGYSPEERSWEDAAQEDAQEEFGWKLVHGDIFRPPRKGMLLSVFLGSGTQILIMTFVTLFFACLGFLSPANRGALMTCAVVLWVLLGTPAGYVAARFYKSFGGEKWKTNVLLTAFLCPGIVFGDFFIMNLILWGERSSAAIPFGTLVAVLALWFCISVPLTFIGAYFGFKKNAIEHPVRTNQIPRQIPEQSFYTQPLPGIIMGGILPFGCIFIQLFFILNSIWSHQMYYMFGFLFLVFIILVITCSEATILLCYFHLCAEDYHWQWRSFLTSGFTAVYFLIYAVHYFFSKLQITGTASTILYFGYTMIMVLIFFLFTGTIGFFACFWFVTKIYSVVKVD
ncbi:transmembrane 9 superfamily member 2 isoform X2 [Rhineura floridana]|uniref:transmembrane 9 superfamily member 2 isoform X2 n=1 Tax=Rhineura floridana TaxID=261503 RepID=UPI002AC8701B|nr:transmembrane 9 superfamily member 2 isoform X2 [Rhineura floridana]